MQKIITFLFFLVLISGCAARDATFKTATIYEPAAKKALVSFVLGRHKHPVSIWDGEEMVGLLMPQSFFQYEAAPGEHLFLGNLGNRVIPLEADLAAGKHYIVRARNFPGVGLRFQPVRGVGIPYEQIQEWFSDYDSMATDLTKLADYEKDRRRYIDRFLKHYIKTMYPEYTVKPGDSYDGPVTLEAAAE